MSLDKFIESQIKLQNKINKLTLNDKLPTSAWMKQVSEINKIVSKLPQFYTIDKLYKEYNFSSPAVLQLSKLSEEIKKISNPISEINSISQYDSIFKQLERFNFPKEIINNINTTSKKLSYISYDFVELIENYEEDEENETSNIILNETSRIENIITDIYHNNELLYTIEPRNFEELIAELLLKQGFDVELSKQTRDNGYDILALKYVNGFSPIKYLVECKRYAEKRKIGVGIIREFKEVIQTENANKGLIVTTSYFTKEALKKQKQTPFLLDYKDKTDVIKWVIDYYTSKLR